MRRSGAGRALGVAASALALWLTTACGDEARPDGVGAGSGGSGAQGGDRCATPNEGCACEHRGEAVDCGRVERRSGDTVWCAMGERECGEDGTWGACLGDVSHVIEGGTTRTAATPSAPCVDNPCDPFCQWVVEDGSNVDAPSGFQETPEGGITLVGQEGELGDTSCTGIAVTPAQATVTVTSFTGQGYGLYGEYFAGVDQSAPQIPADWEPDATRIDEQVNFDWHESEPGPPNIPDDHFSVRWTGFVQAPIGGDYRLCLVADDGVRLWLDDQLVIDQWTPHPVTEHCMLEPAEFVAGTRYRLRVEYFEDVVYAVAQLRWVHEGAPNGEVIPRSSLISPEGTNEAGFTVTPDSVRFSASLAPAGCYPGTPSPAWTLDRVDRADIDATGMFSLRAPLAGPVEVNAYLGDLRGSATVNVAVEVVDDQEAPGDTAELFEDSASGTDPMTVLYPYADTVFPLGLRPPLLQWSSNGTPADAVLIGLRFPATGTPVFAWSKILPEPASQRYQVPTDVWRYFESSAKGGEAAYVIQRVTGGVLRPAVVRRIRFGTAPLRGKIYYTQYGRPNSTAMMVADPGSDAPATNAFPNETGGSWGLRCPVCHTVSANGATFATSDGRWSSNAGLSRINANGTFTNLGDYPTNPNPYQDGANDWRGFAWAPLTPDGKYALAAQNVWGNSREEVVGIDPQTHEVSVPEEMLSGGNGTGLLARYFPNTTATGWDFRRIDPRVSFDFGTGSPSASIPSDFSARWSGEVLPYTTEQYRFEVETTGRARLALGGTTLLDVTAPAGVLTSFSATAPLVRGQRAPIELEYSDATNDAQIYLRWESATVAKEIVPQTQLFPANGVQGLLATYYDNEDFTAPIGSERLEPSLDANWGGGSPLLGMDGDRWSAVYTGQLEAPADGDLTLCADADDAVELRIANTTVLGATAAVDQCGAVSVPVTEGTRYPIEVRYRELTGTARLVLSYQMTGATTISRTVVPSARLTPPAGWAVPEHGLTATYYDREDFNEELATNAPVSAFTRFEPSADLDWGDGRPGYGPLSDGDGWSSRLTGRIEPPCSGVYEFRVAGDDGARLWIDGVRVTNLWSAGTATGALWLEEGRRYDLKLDHHEQDGPASLRLLWRPSCAGATAFAPVPAANLYPTGDAGTAGFARAGGDNGNGRGYFVWQTPDSPGSPQDVTAQTPGRWGLGQTVMMVPSFAPDGSKLVFIDGDSSAGAGWRKGLSVFDFDQAGKVFKNRRLVTSTWPFGAVMKWPAFESDSRSVIYQTTTPGDACCRKTDWPKYGYMGPSNYFEDPGRLWSVDTSASSPAPVELARLNRGERALDRNKAYQATMLPQAAAGYRWVVFTSTRPYGNVLNNASQEDFSDPADYEPMRDYANLQSMLWVSAVDDQTSGASDRSHPAFFLPNQNFSEQAATGYVNERAFWVTEACHPVGSDAASSCDVDEDCCGGSGPNKTAQCRIEAPASVPPVRRCRAIPTASTCKQPEAACVASDECCFGLLCQGGQCQEPPSVLLFQPDNFERVYAAECGAGTKPKWTFFDYKASIPEVGGKLEFFAESSDDPDDFHVLPNAPADVSIDGVVFLGEEGPPGDLDQFAQIDVGAALAASDVVMRKYLKITIRFVPNQDQLAAPVLTQWRQIYSCPPGE